MTDQPQDTKDTKKASSVTTLGSPAHPSSKTVTAAASEQKTPSSQKPAPHASKASEGKTQKQGTSNWLPLLVACAALGFAGYNFWYHQQTNKLTAQKTQALTETNNKISANLSETVRKIQALESQLQRQQQQTQQQQRQISQQNAERKSYETQLQGLVESVAQLEAQAKQQLSLAENMAPTQAITQAMDFAYRKLNFEKDVAGTITLLEAVINTYCLPPATASLMPTCVGLEADRVSLKQVPLPNLNRILQELEGIQNSLLTAKNTNIGQPIISVATPEISTKPASTLESWRDIWGNVLATLGNFAKKHIVRIHHLETEEPVRLSTDQRSNLIHTIVLLIDQGKTASLRGDQQRFSASLNAAADAMKAFLPAEQDPLNHERLLRALSHINLNPELPRLTATYTALSTQMMSSSQSTTTTTGAAPNATSTNASPPQTPTTSQPADSNSETDSKQ